jgi:hypothetical protein
MDRERVYAPRSVRKRRGRRFAGGVGRAVPGLGAVADRVRRPAGIPAATRPEVRARSTIRGRGQPSRKAETISRHPTRGGDDGGMVVSSRSQPLGL